MDDRLAVLIGRVILAYGELDQLIYRQIAAIRGWQQYFDFQKDENASWRSTFIEKAFGRRLDKLRGMMVEITGGEERTLSRFDQLRNRLGDLARKRAHLAHGSLWEEDDDRIVVSDAREITEYQEAFSRLMAQKKPTKDFSALWDRHMSISYSAGDLVALERAITADRKALKKLTSEALHQFCVRNSSDMPTEDNSKSL